MFEYLHNMSKHLLTHTGERPWLCDLCGNRYRTIDNLKAHACRAKQIDSTEAYKLKPYQCSYCSKVFSKSSQLDMHALTHAGAKLWNCSMCERSYSLKKNLVRHCRIKHGNKKQT